MARRSNYSYERSQRDRAKVAKRQVKRDARAARKGGAVDVNEQAAAPDAGLPAPSAVVPPPPPEAAATAAGDGGASDEGGERSD
jgi:hypothetical protein